MRTASTLLFLALSAPLVAQEPAKPSDHADHDMAVQGGGVFPAGWSVRPDSGGSPAAVKFEPMAPGFHLTMGTAAILYRPADRVTAPAHAEATIHLFPSKGASHSEAFGLFIGGQDLAGPGQRYTYFLIRGDGTYKIKRRNGSATSDVTKGWTPSPAITKADPGGPVKNQVSVSVGRDTVRFLVNGTEVYAAAAKDLDAEGIIGLRVNHNLSVHIEGFGVHKM